MRDSNQSYHGKLCFFSKPLHSMADWGKLARATHEMGFDGIDLTVRSGGHVAPERAAEDLLRAAAAIRAAGLDLPMITTALTSASDPTARPILAAAAKAGVAYVKPGYYSYQYKDVREDLAKAGREFRSLAALASKYGLQLGYHIHSENIGAAVWDAAQFIEPLNPKVAGYYLDCSHVTAEGGVGAWKAAAHLAAARLKMVSIKDFYWKTTSKGWEYAFCPLGQGRVDLRYFLGVLAQVNFQGPISLHIEYEPAGETLAEKQANTIVNSARDLAVLKAQLKAAYGSSDK